MNMAVVMITMVGTMKMMLMMMASLTFIHSSVPGISKSELRNRVTVMEMDQWFKMLFHILVCYCLGASLTGQ